MRYALLLCWLQLKRTACSTSFWITGLSFALLVAVMTAVLPQQKEDALAIGVIADGAMAQQTAKLLEQNDGYSFLLYQDEEELKRAILNGDLHCGYLLDETAKVPVTVLLAQNSYMHTLTDEIVLAAWFEVQSPYTAQDFLERSGFDGQNVREQYDKMKAQAPPMQIQLEEYGASQTPDGAKVQSTRELLYAAFIMLYLTASLLAVLVEKNSGRQAFIYLKSFSGHRAATLAAPILADVLLNTAVLAAADAILNWLAPGAGYPLRLRMILFLGLALLAAAFSLLAHVLEKCRTVLFVLLPPAVICGVLCSGAIINPVYLPAGLSLLRFLSPAWYCLRFLSMGT